MFVQIVGNALGDQLAAFRLDKVLGPRHVDVGVGDGRDVLVSVHDAGLPAHSVLRDQEWVALEARNLRKVLSVEAPSNGGRGATNLGLLDLKHLLVFFRVLLNLLVEEEVGDTKADAMSFLAVGWILLLQLLEQFVACQVPGLGQPERDDVGVSAADGGRPFPAIGRCQKC